MQLFSVLRGRVQTTQTPFAAQTKLHTRKNTAVQRKWHTWSDKIHRKGVFGLSEETSTEPLLSFETHFIKVTINCGFPLEA